MSDVLIIEDNRDIAEGLRTNLELEGYTVEIAADGEAGLDRIRQWPPSLVILDLMLPGSNGFQVLRRLRDEGHDMPVLILSARADEAEKVRGFRIGADDYVTKPFGLRELLARVDALFRRRGRVPATSQSKADVETVGEIAVHRGSRTVRRNGTLVALRPKEYDLLEAFIERAERVVSRRELLEVVWGYDESVQTRTVDSHVLELRKKIEADPANPKHIVTVRKSGYILHRQPG